MSSKEGENQVVIAQSHNRPLPETTNNSVNTSQNLEFDQVNQSNSNSANNFSESNNDNPPMLNNNEVQNIEQNIHPIIPNAENAEENQVNQDQPEKLPIITFSFVFFFILNTLAYIHSSFPSFDITDYSLCIWPIANKYQYYRILTSHFYHVGFFHYLTNMIMLYFFSRGLENEIGSIYTIIIGLHSMIVVSSLYLVGMFLLKLLLRLTVYNFNSMVGFSCVCLTYYSFYYCLNKNKNKMVTLMFLSMKGFHVCYLLLFLLQLLTPNSSLIGHLSGVACSCLINRVFSYFTLPRLEWIVDTEKKFNINNKKILTKIIGYVPIKDNSNVLENAKELSKFLNCQKCH